MSETDLVMEFIATLEGLRRYRRWFYERSLPVRHNAMMLLMFLHYHLSEDCPGIQPSELGDLIRVTRPTITSLVNSLEEHGLVERVNDDEDRRVVFVRPTKKGNDVVRQAKADFASGINEMIEYLGAEDGAELMRIMRRVRLFLDDQQKDSGGGKESCGD